MEDNITRLPQPSKEEMEKQMAENVKKQKEEAKAMIDTNDFVLVLAYKATGDDQSPVTFTNMMVTSTKPQLPLLPIISDASELLNEQCSKALDDFKKNLAARARAKR